MKKISPFVMICFVTFLICTTKLSANNEIDTYRQIYEDSSKAAKSQKIKKDFAAMYPYLYHQVPRQRASHESIDFADVLETAGSSASNTMSPARISKETGGMIIIGAFALFVLLLLSGYEDSFQNFLLNLKKKMELIHS